jgi:hypothetical protein
VGVCRGGELMFILIFTIFEFCKLKLNYVKTLNSRSVFLKPTLKLYSGTQSTHLSYFKGGVEFQFLRHFKPKYGSR